jgi:hypothetical protein
VEKTACCRAEKYVKFAQYISVIFKYNQQDATLHMVFITIIALHVSGGSFAHHQELKTVYTASGICRAVIIQYNKLLMYKILIYHILYISNLLYYTITARQIPDAVYTVLSS